MSTLVETPGDVRPRRRGRLLRSDGARRLLELLALTSLAVMQPLLDVTGRAPEFFVSNRAGRLEVLAYLAVVALAPPLVLWSLEQLVGAVRVRAARVLHAVFVVALLTVLAVETGKRVLSLRGLVLLLVAVAAAALVGAVLTRSSTARSYLQVLGAAPLAFAVLFVTTTPSGALVLSSGREATAAVAGGNGAPVVMVVFDELPLIGLLNGSGRIDGRLFPAFARVAGDSTWFRNATGVAGFTPYALPAMLTGTYPQKPVAPSYLLYPDSLFTLLPDAYTINASERISELCPPARCRAPQGGDGTAGRGALGLPQVLRETLTTAREIASPYDAEETPEEKFEEPDEPEEPTDARFLFDEISADRVGRFTSFVESLERADGPRLDFLHVLLPHAAYSRLPTGTRYHVAPRPFANATWARDEIGRQPGSEVSNWQRYLMQLAFTDVLLGRLLDKLDELGTYDESVVVVTSDHGQGIPAGTPHRALVPENTHALAFVPTMIKLPGQREARIDERNFEQVDLTPTIADALDLEIPWAHDGLSGLGERRRPESPKTWFDQTVKAVRYDARDAYRTMLGGIASSLARPELGVEGLFSFGPRKDLVGRRVEDVGEGPPSGVSVELQPAGPRRVERASGRIPAMVWGEPPGVPAGTPVAVSVNGVIGAVPIVFLSREGDSRFAGMLSERLLREGDNDVRAYVVEGDGAATRLRPIELLSP